MNSTWKVKSRNLRLVVAPPAEVIHCWGVMRAPGCHSLVFVPSKSTMAPAGAGAPRVGLRRVTRFNSNFVPVSVWPVRVWPSQTA